MCKNDMDLASIVEDTEQTPFCPQTDRRTDGQGETSIPALQLRWSGVYKNMCLKMVFAKSCPFCSGHKMLASMKHSLNKNTFKANTPGMNIPSNISLFGPWYISSRNICEIITPLASYAGHLANVCIHNTKASMVCNVGPDTGIRSNGKQTMGGLENYAE